MLSLDIRLAAAAALAVLAFLALPATDAADPKTGAKSGVLGYTVTDIDGKKVSLSRYQGKVLLLVNTASKCGYTPQYASLEKLYGKYKGQGLRILAFPANNFGAQEPGTNQEIKSFCSLNYKTTFDLFSKVSVKGEDQAPLYRYLTDKKTNPKFGGEVEWNFTKFLVSRDGRVVGRFASKQDPLSPEVVSAIEAELKKPAAARKPAARKA